jgi:hypothetical protein
MTTRTAIRVGLLLGAAFSAWNVIASQIAPLAEDAPVALLLFYGPMFAAWTIAGVMSSGRTTRIADGAKTGALVALVTFVVLTAVVIARVNLFLEITSQRPDWQNLMLRYRSSGFSSLRAYANYIYFTGAPLKLLVASSIGALCGSIGGCLIVFWGARRSVGLTPRGGA